MSIHIFAKLQFKEGSEAAAHDTIRDLVAASNREEGCIAYAAFVSTNDPTVIRIKEEWASMEALQAHMQEPHFQELGTRHADDFAAPLEVDVTQSL